VRKQLFLEAVRRRKPRNVSVFGTATSIACRQLMDRVDAHFPKAHLDAETMARLAIAGHTVLGFDAVMPLFSVCHEAAAMGCAVNWGGVDAMPEAGKPIFRTVEDIRIPKDLLKRPGCAVPLEAIRLLKNRLGDGAAVCGKVFGGWTQAYHYFGVENFLIGTIDNPASTQRILDALVPVTIAFAKAQIDAGADCILLADHATRDLCSPAAYEQFVAPMHAYLAEQMEVPTLLHICGDTRDRIAAIARTGVDCFHWDTKTGDPEKVRRLAGDKLALMGGISNYTLLRDTPEQVAEAAGEADQGDIDIVGPECAIPLQTPLANVLAIASGS
jgi:[methyl-Co(III) methanol-specific corrinoid protein]:coenzyme M methyltransferase